MKVKLRWIHRYLVFQDWIVRTLALLFSCSLTRSLFLFDQVTRHRRANDSIFCAMTPSRLKQTMGIYQLVMFLQNARFVSDSCSTQCMNAMCCHMPSATTCIFYLLRECLFGNEASNTFLKIGSSFLLSTLSTKLAFSCRRLRSCRRAR